MLRKGKTRGQIKGLSKHRATGPWGGGGGGGGVKKMGGGFFFFFFWRLPPPQGLPEAKGQEAAKP